MLILHPASLRLEAATSRLEDIALASAARGTIAKEVNQPGAGSGAIGAATKASPPADEPKSVRAFDEVIIQAKLKPFLQLSQGITGVVDQQVKLCLSYYYAY